MANTKVEKIQGIRGSNAATAIPSRKLRKQGSRAGRKTAALRDQLGR